MAIKSIYKAVVVEYTDGTNRIIYECEKGCEHTICNRNQDCRYTKNKKYAKNYINKAKET